ncbi:AraC family transcriptional regulator [Streptomyces synnematoformans]|uniref:AraC family transcriptional regulator n=2 Tax=Streptomyces synnematoformans TaxID=415721 RepID=A0ABN2ZDJ0_9ACTN
MSADPVPMHRLEVPAPEVLPFAIGSFDSIGPLSRAGFPHRHTFHEIVYVRAGRGHHVVDQRSWPITPPHLGIVTPGQVHHWERAAGLDGHVMIFTEDFLLPTPGDRDRLRELSRVSWLSPDRRSAGILAALFAEMTREYAGRAPGFISVLQSYLHVLLIRADRLSRTAGTAPESGDGTAGPPAGRAAEIARRFDRLLAEPGPAVAGLSVRGCAASVGVSVGYLNEAVKRATGLTPGHLIRQAQAREAKRLLAATDLTVRQVARLAGFSDPAYFSRFFRRETGSSPGDFRRGSRADHHDRRILSIDCPGTPE